jgi:hypothetical protein
VLLDITTEGDSRTDQVGRRFDVGIHLGEFVQRDMVAVRVTGRRLSTPWSRHCERDRAGAQ